MSSFLSYGDAFLSCGFGCLCGPHQVAASFLVPKWFPSVLQDMHARMSVCSRRLYESRPRKQYLLWNMILILLSTGPYSFMASHFHTYEVYPIPLHFSVSSSHILGDVVRARNKMQRGTLWNAVSVTSRKLLPDTQECPTHVFLFQW